jgi:Peptidase family C25/Surface adhesin CshA repetitive domain/CARDB/Secretion system C-terminal sorting domain
LFIFGILFNPLQFDKRLLIRSFKIFPIINYMNRLYKTLYVLFFCFQLNAQTFTNNWINTSSNYAKITVSKTGIYEITGQELAVALPSIIGVPSNSLSVIFQGKPIAIEVIAAGATFQASDKIRFFGKANTGDLETELYRPITDQPHKLISLFSNKSSYFLSSNAANTKLITNETEVASGNTITQVTSKSIVPFYSEYTFNSTTGPIPLIQFSYFERGEGPTGPIIRATTPTTFKVSTKGIISGSAKLELLLNGRDLNNRVVRIQTANKDTTVNLFGFFHSNVKLNLTIALPVPQDSLPITVSSDIDRFSVSLITLIYTKTESNVDQSGSFYLPANANAGNVVFTKSNITEPQVYNITDVFNVKKLKLTSNSPALNFVTDPAIKTKENSYFYTTIGIKPDSIKAYNSQMNINPLANYIIISNKKLKASAERYRDFRNSAQGGGHIVELVYAEDIYNDFGYGIQSPLAIKNYLRLKLSTSAAKNLLLLGKAFSAHTGINSATDLVPSIGYPASDMLLSSGINTHIDVYGIATGRIPALTDTEVDDYLQKVKNQLNFPQGLERKKVFHFNGGKTISEISNFGGIMDNLGAIAKASNYGISFAAQRKTDPPAAAQPANLGPLVNSGQAMMGYFGHSSYTTLDYNIGFATNASLGFNNSQYPVFYFSGCAFNNYFREIVTLSKDWIFAKDKGSIAIIGQSYYGYESSLTKHGIAFYETLFKSPIEPTLGEALKTASQIIQSKPGFTSIDILNNNQTLLFGDPVIKVFGYTLPDFVIDQTSFSQSVTGTSRTVKFKIRNFGKTSPTVLKVKITEEGLPNTIVKTIDVPNLVSVDSFSVVLDNVTILSKIKIEVDNLNGIAESNETNNNFVFIETLGTNPTIATDDIMGSLPAGSIASVNILQNDKLFNASQATTTNTTVDLDPLTPAIETSLLVTGQGTWSYVAGLITFTPLTNFNIDPKPLIYSLLDNTTLGKSLATVIVDYKPLAANNTSKFAGGAITSFNVLTNDILGDSVKTNTVNLIGSAGIGQPLIITGQGTWSVAAGVVTFSPALGFFADPTPIKYTVQDAQGNISNEASIILDALPLAKNDISGYNKGDLISMNVLNNDNQGDILDLSTLKLVGTPNTSQSEGLWTITPGTGFVTFTPNSPNSLVPPIISYQISDFQGNVTIATIELDGNPPVAIPDDGSYSSGISKTVNVFLNDVSGDKPVEAFLIDPDLNSNGKRKTVTNQGVWDVLPDNFVKFTPLATFGGSPTAVRYYSIDSQGSSSNEAAITFASILPVELTIFKGEATSSGNLISWKAKSERGFSHFEILKSADLNEFYSIKNILGNTSKSYSYLDKAYIQNVKYYQLKMVDLDGTIQYSRIISVIQKTETSDWLVYPNPISGDKININYSKKVNSIQIFDLSGKLISDQLKIEKGIISLDGICTDGEYLLVLNTDEGKLSKRITVIK